MSKQSASNIHYFEDDDSPYESSALYHKPKNNPISQHSAPSIHPAIQIIFWALVGVVGLALAIGATIVAANEPVGDEWTIAFPLAYMVAAMYFFVKATR
jgi:hypothetical protein